MPATRDDHPLRQTARPDFEDADWQLRAVDLFAGCGGLALGLAQAAHDHGAALSIPLAVDFEPAATGVYTENFPSAGVEVASVEDFFDGALGTPLTCAELRVAERCGEVHILVGGPPCQGHSDLNNRTRREDPKNALYARMGRAAEVLLPAIVLIENVPAVQHDRGNVVGLTTDHLSSLGYRVAARTLRLQTFGVAQTRRRHVLLATRLSGVDPAALLDRLGSRESKVAVDLEWAIGDLENLLDETGYDAPPRANSVNAARMEYLLQEDLYDLPNELRPKCHQNEHSYKSMYGRLRWDLPAQTITSGFGCIGQGRYMHPSRARALTAHEAARIQGFPDYFDFSSVKRRTALAQMIGNAVPPALSRELATALISHLQGPRATAAEPETEPGDDATCLELVASRG